MRLPAISQVQACYYLRMLGDVVQESIFDRDDVRVVRMCSGSMTIQNDSHGCTLCECGATPFYPKTYFNFKLLIQSCFNFNLLFLCCRISMTVWCDKQTLSFSMVMSISGILADLLSPLLQTGL